MDSDYEKPPGLLRNILTWAYVIFIHLIFISLVALGALIIHAMIRDWRAGEIAGGEALFIGGFGAAMLMIGIGFFYLGYIGGPRFLERLEKRRERYSNRPWMLNNAWRVGRIVHSTKFTAWFMWFWCIAWWGIIGFIWSVNHDLIIADLNASWDTAIPASIPFVAGIIGILVAIGVTWKRWRHGDAVLVIETLPGFMGDRFQGKVSAGLRKPLREAARIELHCLSRARKTVRVQQQTSVHWVDEEIWSTGYEAHPTQTIYDRGMVTIPVKFDLPEGLPESGYVLDEPRILWLLKIVPGTVLDNLIACEFEIPVFARR